jgi:hypothetical protein
MYENKLLYYINIHKNINLIPDGSVPDRYNFWLYDNINDVYLTRDIFTYNYVKNTYPNYKIFLFTNSQDIFEYYKNDYNIIYFDIPDFIRLVHSSRSVFNILNTQNLQIRQYALTQSLIAYNTNYIQNYIKFLKEKFDTIAIISNESFQNSYNSKITEISVIKSAYEKFYNWLQSEFNIAELEYPNLYSVGKYNFILSGNYINDIPKDEQLKNPYPLLIEYPFYPKLYKNEIYWILPKTLSQNSKDIQYFIDNNYIEKNEETDNLEIFEIKKYYDFDLNNSFNNYFNAIKNYDFSK